MQVNPQGAHTSSVSVYVRNTKMYGRILKSLNIVKLCRGMPKKVKAQNKCYVPQLPCIAVSVALNGEFERCGFCDDCCYTLL